MNYFVRHRDLYTKNLKLALPVMFSYIGHILVQITDNIMLGHVGTMSLAASSFGVSIFIAGLLFCVGFSAAMTPLVGAEKGAGNLEGVAKWLKTGSVSNFALGVVVTTLMLLLTFFLDDMGQTPEVAMLAKPFYVCMVISILPVMVFQTLKQFAEGMGNTRVAMLITVQEVIVNIGLNYVLIFGHWGFPKLGILGSGIATLCARLSMPITFLLVVRRFDFFQPVLKLYSNVTVSVHQCKKYFTLGIPMAGQTILEVIAFAGGAIMMGWIGATEQAAHQIAIGLASLTFMGASGIAAAGTITVSQYRGAGDREKMRAAGFTSLHLVLVYMFITALLFWVFRFRIPFIYTNDTLVIVIAAKLLLLAAVFQLFDGAQVVLLAALRGLTDAKVPTVIAFIAYVIVALPTSYVTAFVFGWREVGIWTGYVVGLMFSSVLFFYRFYTKSSRITLIINP